MNESRHKDLTLCVLSNQNDVIFSVHDQGPGVSEDIKDRLFESFFSTKSEGTGIGLNICRSVIESHGGKLWFENHQRIGCVFYFSIPIFELEPNTSNSVKQNIETKMTATYSDIKVKTDEISL